MTARKPIHVVVVRRAFHDSPDYVWGVHDDGGLYPDPPTHVQELAAAALDIVLRQTVVRPMNATD